MLDSLWQGVRVGCLGKLTFQLSYWLLGAMCSTPELGAKLVAVYKTSASVGAAIAYQLTTDNVSARIQFISNWVLVAASLLVARE